MEIWKNPICKDDGKKIEVARNRYQCGVLNCAGHMCMGGITCDKCGDPLYSHCEFEYYCLNPECELYRLLPSGKEVKYIFFMVLEKYVRNLK